MPFLLILSIVSPVIPLLAGYQKHKLPLLWYYPLAGLIFDVLISFLKRGLHLDQKWPGNLFILIEFLLISFIYRKKLFRNEKLYFSFVTLLSLFFIIHTISNSVWIINWVGSSVFSLTYIIYGIAGLYTILKKQEVVYLEKSWFFWLNIAVILYASGNFLLFLFRDYMIKADQRLFLSLWNNFFLSLNIIKNLLIAVSLYYLKKDVQYESH